MKAVHVCIGLCVAMANLANAETIQTTDGRTIELNDDGTYTIIGVSQPSFSDYVELGEPFVTMHSGEYNQDWVRFMPTFRNLSDKAVLGMKFTTVFKNAFGDPIFEFSGESNERVEPGQTSTASVFYQFKDNQFVGGEAYDKLMPIVTAGTAIYDTHIDVIVLEGGEIVNFAE